MSAVCICRRKPSTASAVAVFHSISHSVRTPVQQLHHVVCLCLIQRFLHAVIAAPLKPTLTTPLAPSLSVKRTSLTLICFSDLTEPARCQSNLCLLLQASFFSFLLFVEAFHGAHCCKQYSQRRLLSVVCYYSIKHRLIPLWTDKGVQCV